MLCEALLGIFSPFFLGQIDQLLDVEVPTRETDSPTFVSDVILSILQLVEEALWLPGDLIQGRDELGENQEFHSSSLHFDLRF